MKMKRLALFVIPHACVMMFCLIMIFLGLAAPFINGFAIDAQENLYVGEGRVIRIFRQGVCVGEIDIKSDAYSFGINSANELIVAFPSIVYRMDTAGNILEKWEDPIAETYQKLQNGTKTVTAPNGNKYRRIGELGWTRILKNGTEEVYRLSTLSFVVKVLLFLCVVSLFVNGVWLVHWLRSPLSQ